MNTNGCDYCEIDAPCCDAHEGAPWLVEGAAGFNGIEAPKPARETPLAAPVREVYVLSHGSDENYRRAVGAVLAAAIEEDDTRGY